MMSKNIIYGLRDPRTNEIRYVGKSTSGMTRPRIHTSEKVLARDRTYKGNWIKSLVSIGLRPEIVVLQELKSKEELSEAERLWIAIGRAAIGSRLTNLTDGGDGVPGLVRTPESKAKMSEIMKVSSLNPETKIARTKAMLDVHNRPDVKERKSNKMKEAWSNTDVRNERIRVMLDPNVSLKRRAAQREAWKNLDSLERLSRASREVWTRPGYREKKIADSKIAVKAAWADPIKKARRLALSRSTRAINKIREGSIEVCTGMENERF